MRWWWLSFADSNLPKGTQFLGACLVRAHGMIEAIRVAHVLEINPGGEVQAVEATEDFNPPAEWTERLLNRDECAAFDRAMDSRVT